MAKKNLGKLCPFDPCKCRRRWNGEVEIQAYSFTENEDGTEGDLQPIPEDSDAEWDMIEEVFNSFMEEDTVWETVSPQLLETRRVETSGDVLAQLLETRKSW